MSTVSLTSNRNFELKRAFALTIKTMARSPRRVLVNLVGFCAGVAPLYLLGYHLGAIPILGIVLSSCVGAGLVCWNLKTMLVGDLRSMARCWPATAILSCLGMLSLYGFFALFDYWVGFETAEMSAIVANSNAYFWKPIAHVAMGSLIPFAILPSLLVSRVVCIVRRVSIEDAGRWSRERIEGVAYPWGGFMCFLAIASLTVVWIQPLAVVCPLFIAGLGCELYRRVF